MIKVGIIGAGRIAGTMAATLRDMTSVESYAVAARDYDRAEQFAREYGFNRAYGSYEAMLADEAVDLVYIATPHSHHYEHIKLCLEHGKHVLCEKAFTVNEKQAAEVFAIAKEKGLLLTEAIWSRYMPMRGMLEEVIVSGVIGEPQMLTASLCAVVMGKERMSQPELAGGALLDLGIYPLNFASMVFGNQIDSITGTATLSELGVDTQNSITLVYSDGKMAVLNSNALCIGDQRCAIYGDNGFIEVDNINNHKAFRVYDRSRNLIAEYKAPKQISGYEYEVEACLYAIEHGELECPQMPHAETLQMMRWMDELRRQWGIVYPMELDCAASGLELCCGHLSMSGMKEKTFTI